MEIISSIFRVFSESPFMQGLSIGMFIALVGFAFGFVERKQLKQHVLSHMKIYGEGEKRLLSELEKLKEQVSNLKNRVMEYKSKPGRAELQELYILDRSLRLMNQRAPGFAAAWEMTRNEVEKKIEEVDSGLIAWSKKVVLPHSSWVKRVDSRLDTITHLDKDN